MILENQDNKPIYSDGTTTEENMLNIARQYPEDLSQDYIANCSDYTVNNTFSAVRENILNWYPFKGESDILEVGAGMGSITGMLCNKARHVTALEMSEARTKVIKARYSGRKNLSIVCDDIFSWKTEEKYDYIIFIGVLEYATVFCNEERPYEVFLTRIKSLLKQNGKILFAIENKFGLKYWLGASEDHLQEPFVGIEGYKQSGTPRTYSKHELEIMLKRVGFENYRFYYVYPDYKFPEIICTDDYAPSYMNLQKVSFTYSKNSILSLDERKVYKDIIENNVWQFMANSFLVEASVETLENDYIVHVSARGESKKQYRVSTLINNKKQVFKVPMHPYAKKHIEDIWLNTKRLRDRGINVLELQRNEDNLCCDYYSGVSAQDYFCNLLLENDRKGLYAFIEKYRNTLLLSSELSTGACITDEMPERDCLVYQKGPILKYGYIDLTFYNSFFVNDEFIFYDQEWCFENVPLNFIMFYAFKSAYSRAEIDTSICIDEIWDYLGIVNDLDAFQRLESYIWSLVLYRQTDFYGADGYCNRFGESKTLSELVESKKCFEEQAQCLEKTVSEQKEVLKELETKQEEYEKNWIKEEDRRKKIEQQYEELAERFKTLTERFKTLTEEEEESLLTIAELRQEVLNKEGHIELLLPVEREYKKIISSKMFKVMRFVCRTYDIVMIIPRFVGRQIFAFCKMLTHVNIPKLKIAAGYVKNEGIVGAYRHLMQDYHQGELKQIHVEVENPMAIQEPEKADSISYYKKLYLPKAEKVCVSIIIPVYNQFSYTYHCIRSIIENSGNIAYEVILADDCSTDLTVDIDKVVENLIIERTTENLRFLRNCNNAAKAAKGKYILFLNNDTQVQKNWLAPLVELCEKDETIGMAGSKLVYADGTLQEAGGIIWKDGTGWNYGRNDDAMKPEYNYVRDVDYISGASLMIRTDLWKKIGGFDELYVPAYCEDSDLAFEVRKTGYRVVYQPLSVVVHFEGKSNGTDLKSGVKKYQVENNLKLRKKWKDELERQYENGQHVFRARERGQEKKIILVIDHYVPQFDKDAGSKTTYQYLKMFIRQGYSVKFIGDNFYQHEPYTTILQQLGVEVLYGTWYAQHWKEWIQVNRNEIDFAYLNRPHITIKYIDFLKNETNIKCIYYGHDLHFLRLQREYALEGDEKKLQEAQDWKEKELYIMRKADMSYYPSCVEEEEIHKIDPKIRVKAITAYVYENFRNTVGEDFEQREGIMFVGGFGHPPNEDAVLWFAERVLPYIRKERDIPFYIVGSNPTDRVKKLAGNNVIVKGFVSEEELQKLYDTCKLVVVPLRYGAGVKGKVVEAIYYGTPMVTTSVGIEGIEGAENIIRVEDGEKEFADAVLELYENNAMLKKMSDEYREFVKKNFSVDAVWETVKEDFSKE